MQTFDALSLNCPIFGPHLLEASAGTGKTFSIEHIFVRLILEGVEIEKILAVTFTRAATRELKARIRANLEKAVSAICNEQPLWSYLTPHLGSENSIRCLSDALAGFDQCQIFTIHGFCFRMLKEFAFEAKVGSLSDPDQGKKIPKNLRLAALDFLESVSSLLCQEQVALLFKEFDSLESIVEKLVQCQEFSPSLCFSECLAKCKAALHVWGLEEVRLLEDFSQLKENYKAAIKGDFESQVKGLVNEAFFPMLLKGKGSLFDFLSPKNRKVRAKEISSLHYPGFFDWAIVHIAPLVKQKVFPILQRGFQPIAEKILEEEGSFDPDAILRQMQEAIGHCSFKERIQQKYEAVIIDEFQDTDAIQWDIFQKLFLNMRALYLVGDPKQSIYRFRKADIYTYLQARGLLGEENAYLLNTNFRSSKQLTYALNSLFDRDWLSLPKMGKSLPYHPVQAGAEIHADFPDEKGAIHFVVADGESLFEEAFLPYAVKEIERLNLKQCAILVKDRYQGAKALALLKSRGIAAVAKSQKALGQTEAFQAIVELFDAILSPHDPTKINIVMAGPFAREDLYLPEYKRLLEEEGLVFLARELKLDSHATQIFELLFAWEKEEGFSFEGLMRYLKQLKNLSPDEGGAARVEVNEEAVQIMTLHIAKGLEFDVVFALGLASRTPQSEEIDELDAEKMRQLYVAMTRAKKRLYVPIALLKKEPALGTHSPMELFSKHFQGSFIEEIERLSKKESITLERLSLPIHFEPLKSIHKEEEVFTPLPPHPFCPSTLFSFTTLAQAKESQNLKELPKGSDLFDLQTMPRGSDTGVAIHAIFESLFSSKDLLWQNPKGIDSLVSEHLRYSPLEPWEKAIQKMVKETLLMPFQGDGEWFSLSEINQFQVEMEFVYSDPPDYVKGFIDLIFMVRGKVYFIDWKTNWLENYEPAQLKKAMEAHDYGLQAKLYSEAIRRHAKAGFGGAFYVFVRGPAYIPISNCL